MNIFNTVIMMFETLISIMFIFLILDYTSKENIIRFMIFWIGEMIISIMYNYHFLTDYTLLFVKILYYLGITYYLSRKDIFTCFFVAVLNNILLLFSNALVLVTVNSISYMITYNIYSNNLVNFISKVVFLLLSFIFHKYFKKYIFEKFIFLAKRHGRYIAIFRIRWHGFSGLMPVRAERSPLWHLKMRRSFY